MTHSLWTIILAAGRGSRLASSTGGKCKQFLHHEGHPLYWRSVLTMSAIPELAGVVLVFPAHELDRCRAELENLKNIGDPGVRILAVSGGDMRQDSVRLGLAALPRDCERVLVHDSARPFFSAALVHTLLAGLTDEACGVIPAIAVTDTVKQVENDLVLATPPRETLRAAQTPQLFPTALLRRVHEQALAEGWAVTDDAGMIERAGFAVRVVPGETANLKITTPEDLRVLATPAPLPVPCTGFGYDVHAYGGNRPMVLGGMPIAGAPFIKAHSDGDVLLHALCDAILGCLGLGDIGEHFPDSDDKFENISSAILLSEVMDKARSQGLVITHVDLTVIAQTPRLAPHKTAIRGNVARLLELSDLQVNVKATTEEHLGFTGRKEGIKAVAVVTGARTPA
ncbi:MAG: 2-C-methyl-D-erythritol 4-phosphate cytidylyltransferase [Desulfomicrobium sp.]|nr:2-C-methyl-D-erythritol 4-phosphate cytidylyltransferase [Pseudomonadota bacterium]MBV1713842.1 2-C-methyl-D-erythritol 4-phosphate cytidylyltransferase [Desulfomicrobium sp.]MBU4572377.1 2-C-methyl-D-erythritol 4-phosphate cytidylyltransferase [Pseudomonadota bacterium]MBU4594357.1 2-C-methyl-D-erythritol 4-phosphate cytidylyltransferase [Pseudomonadota bacterium]MBV1719524.1 2-C-methyl-D-erythritol 4-phosphate cytidylyltransferase [Desulfomicrobium sp.]